MTFGIREILKQRSENRAKVVPLFPDNGVAFMRAQMKENDEEVGRLLRLNLDLAQAIAHKERGSG